MMSNSPIDSNGSDKEKMLSAFGGKKGLIDSGVPSVTFLRLLGHHWRHCRLQAPRITRQIQINNSSNNSVLQH
jgi:hypothetical protein